MPTPRWSPVQIVDGAYADESRPFSAQDTVNYLPVAAEQSGTYTPAKLRQVPGMTFFCLTENAPIRGMRNVEGALMVVAGNHLYQVKPNATTTVLGTVPGVGRTRMSHNQVANGNQLAIPTGSSGYVYDTSTSTFQQITNASFPGAITFDFIDQFITGVAPNRQQAFFSDLTNALSYNGLDTVQASAAPDKLVGQITSHEQWWLMGERTIQPFSNTGQATGTFTADQGMTIERGCASAWCMQILDNTVFWLGENGVVYRANGYTPQRISTYAIENAIAQCDISRSFSFIWEDKGHAVYYLTFPDGHTWGYDVSANKWHRRKSYGLDRWRINDLVNWNGAWYAGDYANGAIYRLDWLNNTEDHQPLERVRVTGVLQDAKNRIRVNAVELIIDTGLPTPIQPLILNGDLANLLLGDAAYYRYVAIGGLAPYRFEIISGSLPSGLSMNSAGLITGTAIAAGSYSWTVQVTDVTGLTATLPDTCVVSPMTVVGNLSNGTVGDVVSFAYTNVGGIPPITFTIDSGALPTGLSMSSSGVVTGTYTTAGTYPFTVKATDALGNTATDPQNVVVQTQRYAKFYSATPTINPGWLTTPWATPILGSSDFTLEFEFLLPNVIALQAFGSGRAQNISGWAIQVHNGQIEWRQAINGHLIDTIYNITGGSVSANVLHHVAITRQGNVFNLWLDGALVGTVSAPGPINETSVTQLALGTSFLSIGENPYQGYMKWYALTIGTCRYTAPFTPPPNAASITGATSSIDFNGPIGSTTFTDHQSHTWTTTGYVKMEAYP